MFITGVGVGYVLGTRAGRQKFDQMVAQARKVWESPSVQEAAGVVQTQAARLYDQGKQAVTEQVHKLNTTKSVTADEEDSWATNSTPRDFPANAF